MFLPGNPFPEPLPDEWQRFVPYLSDAVHRDNPDTQFTGARLAEALGRMIDGESPLDTADWLKEQVYGS